MTAQDAGTPSQIPVTLPGAVRFDMLSRVTGRTYRIFVAKPEAEAPPEGYPLVIATDGNLNFPLAATMNTAFAMNGGAGALVVGVGYPTEDRRTLGIMRARDLTPPTPPEAIDARMGLPTTKLEDFGGSEDFYRFLVEELQPAIAADYPVNMADRTLYGYSWGGLFVLTVLFNHPESFRNFAACSPSIWWNDRGLLKGEAEFARLVETKAVSPRILITIGAREQEAPAASPPGMTREQLEALIAEARMVDNAGELATRLRTLTGGPDYVVRYQAFEAEDHTSAIAASVTRALAFALRP